MPYSTTIVSTKPIILTKMTGTIDFADCEVIWNLVDDIVTDQADGLIYWIIDMTQMVMSYSDMIRMIEGSYGGVGGTVTDLRVYPVIVGALPMMMQLREIIEDRDLDWPCKTKIPFFPSIEEALLFLQIFCS